MSNRKKSSPLRIKNRVLKSVFIKIGTAGISKTVVAALVSLSGNEALYEPLVKAVNGFNFPCQVLDDLVNTKQDSRNFALSILLDRVFKDSPQAFEQITHHRRPSPD